MKTRILIAAALMLSPAAAQAQTPSGQSASDLTRQLNGAPPMVQRPIAPAPAPAPAPAAQTPAATPARPVTTPAPTASSARPARAGAATTRPAATPAPAPAPAAPRQAAPAAPPAPLTAAAIAALPFRIELPAGFQIVEGRSGPDFDIYSVRGGGKTYAMIYAGPSSQYPIYDGQAATVSGRTSIVVEDGGRRTAMEHLFQRDGEPKEIHVWLTSLSGAELTTAERIGQSVDPR